MRVKLLLLLVSIALVAMEKSQAQSAIATSAEAQDNAPVAGDNLPSPPAPGYGLTPAGWFHKTCVFEVADNEWAEEGAIHEPDGSIRSVPPCPYPSIPFGPAAGSVPTVNGWATFGQQSNSNGFSFLFGQFTVPQSPTHTGETIFIFPGITDPQQNFIIQPVLQYGVSLAGGGNFWTIGSWACGTTASTCHHSSLSRVSVGDVIDGVLSGARCVNGVCDWTITADDISNNQSTRLNWQAGQVYPSAFVTLELDNLSNCNQLPNQNHLTMGTELKNRSGAVVTGAWQGFTNPVSPNCGFRATSANGSSVTLDWTP